MTLPAPSPSPEENTAPEAERPAGGWLAWLALNASTGALLGAILLVGMATELWSPLIPEYLDQLQASILEFSYHVARAQELVTQSGWARGADGTRASAISGSQRPL